MIKLAENCQYGGLCDDLIRNQLVSGIKDDKVREKLLGTKDLKLDRTIEILKTNQALKFRVKDMASVAADEPIVNKVRHKRSKVQPHSRGNSEKFKKPDKKPPNTRHKQISDSTCKFCGKIHEFKRELCPAVDKECHKCKKKGHFATICQSAKKLLHTLGDEQSVSEEELAKKRHM